MRAPCEGCKQRRPGSKGSPPCHSTCEAYQAFWAHNRKENLARQQRNEDISAHNEAKRGASLWRKQQRKKGKII